MRCTLLSILSLLIGLPVLAADADAPAATDDGVVEFHFKAEPGDAYRSRITTQTFGSITMFAPLPPQKFAQTFEQEIAMECVRVEPDGTVVFKMTMPSVAMEMNMGGVKMEVDTRKPPVSTRPEFDLVRRIFEAMTRIECELAFSAQGEPLRVEGLSEGLQEVLEEATATLPMPSLKKMFDQMRDQLGDSIIEENLRATYRMFPDGGKARVGDTWTRDWTMQMPPMDIAAKGNAEYELAGVEEFRGRRCAKIRIKSTISTLPKPASAPSGEGPRSILDRMNFTMNASGGNGVAYVDPATGQVLQFKETQRSVIEMSLEPDPDAQAEGLREGMGKMTQTLNTSVRIEMLDDDAPADASTEADDDQAN